MANYIDGFVFPIARKDLRTYEMVSHKVAAIWKEHGALDYFEYVGNDMVLEGTRSFGNVLVVNKDEVVVFGWVVFPSKKIRVLAHKSVSEDPRMDKIISPLTLPDRLIFEASRMVFGGFEQMSR